LVGRSAGAQAIEHFDVLVVGAGISGIDAGYRLQTECQDKSFCILEAREAIGGTWDLFRYPGVRSDSDMHTLGFPFRPWRDDKSIVDGPAILRYIRDTAREFRIDRRIRFGHRVTRAAWSSSEGRWTVETEAGPELRRFTCNFLYMCSGYYDYAKGHQPDFPGAARFGGRIVHPQQWPGSLDYAGKRIAVIGSGATAVTLAPALAEKAAHVTIVQRSPSYVVARPSADGFTRRARRWLPGRLADAAIRWKDVLVGASGYRLSKRRPALVRRALMAETRRALGPEFDVEKHFSPSYPPWDQRMCLAPDGDLFAAMRSGRLSVVTDRIECFTETGLRLASGEEIDADIVITATGLVVRLLGGTEIVVDGAPINLAEKLVYKGMMANDVPNLALAFGYINASWTLRCDLTARAVCRLLKHMDRRSYARCTPRLTDTAVTKKPLLDFSSGYVRRAEGVLPKQGSKAPWRVHQNYLLDMLAMRYGRIEDGVLEFAGRKPKGGAS
jgi:cation diffusion facilitator CzcD-associated flavoprotein CzcO